MPRSQCPTCTAPWYDPTEPRPQLFVRWHPCQCVDQGGHHVYECASCRVDHFDPPCAAPYEDVSGLAAPRRPSGAVIRSQPWHP